MTVTSPLGTRRSLLEWRSVLSAALEGPAPLAQHPAPVLSPFRVSIDLSSSASAQAGGEQSFLRQQQQQPQPTSGGMGELQAGASLQEFSRTFTNLRGALREREGGSGSAWGGSSSSSSSGGGSSGIFAPQEPATILAFAPRTPLKGQAHADPPSAQPAAQSKLRWIGKSPRVGSSSSGSGGRGSGSGSVGESPGLLSPAGQMLSPAAQLARAVAGAGLVSPAGLSASLARAGGEGGEGASAYFSGRAEASPGGREGSSPAGGPAELGGLALNLAGHFDRARGVEDAEEPTPLPRAFLPPKNAFNRSL